VGATNRPEVLWQMLLYMCGTFAYRLHAAACAMHCMLPWSHAVLVVLMCRQTQECLAERQSLRLHLFGSQRNSFSSKVLQSNHVSNIVSMTFVPSKLCIKRCRPKHYSLFLVNVCNCWGKQISGLFLLRSWMRQQGGACPSSSTSPSLVQLPAAK